MYRCYPLFINILEEVIFLNNMSVDENEYFRKEYDKILSSFEDIDKRKKLINQKLSVFIIDVPIGYDVYGDNSYFDGPDIQIPQNADEFHFVMNEIQKDIHLIESLSSNISDYLQKLNSFSLDSFFENVYDELKSKTVILKEYVKGRQDVLTKLKKSLDILDLQESSTSKNYNSQHNNSSSHNSSNYSSGAGESNNGGGVPSPNSARSSNVENADRGDYKSIMSFPKLQSASSISESTRNIAEHEKSVSSILSHVVLNGKVIGGDVYDVSVDPSTLASDVNFDFAALQLALDYVDADIEAMSLLISQVEQKISENQISITTKQSQMEEYEEVATYDDEGNYTRIKVPKYNIDALQSEITALTEEIEQLESDKIAYVEKMDSKKSVMNELLSVRNAYNVACDGMLDVFTASAFLDLMHENIDSPDLYGVPLTYDQKVNLFKNLEVQLNENRDNYSFMENIEVSDKFSKNLELYDSVLGACSQMGELLTTFKVLNDSETGDSALSRQIGLNQLLFNSDSMTMDSYFEVGDSLDSLLLDYQGQVQDFQKKLKKLKIEFNSEYGDAYYNHAISEEEYNRLFQEKVGFLETQVGDILQAMAVLNGFKNYAYQQAFEKIKQAEDFLDKSSLDFDSAEWKWLSQDSSYDEPLLYNEGTFVFRNSKTGEIVNPTELEIAEYFSQSDEDRNTLWMRLNWLPQLSSALPNAFYDANEIREYLEICDYSTEEELQIMNYLHHIGRDDWLAKYVDYQSDISVQRRALEEVQRIKDKIENIERNSSTIVDQMFFKPIEGIAYLGHQIFNGSEEWDDSKVNQFLEKTYGSVSSAYKVSLYLDYVGLFKGLNNFYDGIGNLFNPDGKRSVEDYKTIFLMDYLNSKYENNQLMRLLATGGFEISSSIGNMLPSILVSIATMSPIAGAAVMGVSAGGNAQEQGLQMGLTRTQAALYGALNGLSEASLQYFLGGIASLGNGTLSKSLSTVIKSSFLREMLSEGFEESLQSVLDPLFITLVTEGQIPYSVDWNEVIKSGIYGMITAGIMNGGSSIVKMTIDGIVYEFSINKIDSLIDSYKDKDLTDPSIHQKFVEDLSSYQESNQLKEKTYDSSLSTDEMIDSDDFSEFFDVNLDEFRSENLVVPTSSDIVKSTDDIDESITFDMNSDVDSNLLFKNDLDISKLNSFNISDGVLSKISQFFLENGIIKNFLDFFGDIKSSYEFDDNAMIKDIFSIYIDYVLKGKIGDFSSSDLELLSRVTVDDIISQKSQSILGDELQNQLNQQFTSFGSSFINLHTNETTNLSKGTMRAYVNPIDADTHFQVVDLFIRYCLDHNINIRMKPTAEYDTMAGRTDKIVFYFDSLEQIQALEYVTNKILEKKADAFATPTIFGFLSDNKAFSFGLDSIGIKSDWVSQHTGRQYMDALFRYSYAKSIVESSTVIQQFLSDKIGFDNMSAFLNNDFDSVVFKGHFFSQVINYNCPLKSLLIENILSWLEYGRSHNLFTFPEISSSLFRDNILLFNSIYKYSDTKHRINPALDSSMIESGLFKNVEFIPSNENVHSDSISTSLNSETLGRMAIVEVLNHKGELIGKGSSKTGYKVEINGKKYAVLEDISVDSKSIDRFITNKKFINQLNELGVNTPNKLYWAVVDGKLFYVEEFASGVPIGTKKNYDIFQSVNNLAVLANAPMDVFTKFLTDLSILSENCTLDISNPENILYDQSSQTINFIDIEANGSDTVIPHRINIDGACHYLGGIVSCFQNSLKSLLYSYALYEYMPNLKEINDSLFTLKNKILVAYENLLRSTDISKKEFEQLLLEAQTKMDSSFDLLEEPKQRLSVDEAFEKHYSTFGVRRYSNGMTFDNFIPDCYGFFIDVIDSLESQNIEITEENIRNELAKMIDNHQINLECFTPDDLELHYNPAEDLYDASFTSDFINRYRKYMYDLEKTIFVEERRIIENKIISILEKKDSVSNNSPTDSFDILKMDDVYFDDDINHFQDKSSLDLFSDASTF